MSQDRIGGLGEHRPPQARIPVKVHRNVSLVRVADPILADELLARPKLGRVIVGRLTADCLLVTPGKAAEVVDELRKMGHTPQVIGG
jgi:hypothetical protein